MATISVTEHHIKTGIRKTCSMCPISLAIGDVLKPDFEAKVRYSVAELDHKKNKSPRRLRHLPESAVKFIRVFDGLDEGQPSPFEFELDIPAELLKCPPSPTSS